MSLGISLLIGLLLGSVYVATKRIRATSELRMAGAGMLVKWGRGIGRSSVVEVRGATMRLSSPVMRDNYAPPEPGGEVLIKPLDGGPVRRARFVAHGDSGWTVQFSA